MVVGGANVLKLAHVDEMFNRNGAVGISTTTSTIHHKLSDYAGGVIDLGTYIPMVAGLKTVILLSFVLAVGFLLVILSCALFANWLPLLVALTFVIAPLPNAIFSHCGAADDFGSSDYESNPAVDLGRFITSCIVVTGFAMPVVLAHAEVIRQTAALMSIVGGGLVYGTILSYSAVFKQDTDEF